MAGFDDEYDDDEEQDEETDEQDDEQGEEDEEDLTEEEVAAADAAEDQYVKNEKENKKQEILRQFLLLKSKYLLKSSFWPFLSFSELKLCNQVKKISYPQYASFMHIVEMKKGAFAAKVNSILSAIVPILPYILIGLVVIIAIVVIFGTINPKLVGDDAGGMSSPLGAKGDCFYGVRTIYRDAEKSKDDLRDDYVDMLTYTISNFESSDVTLNITLPAEDYNFADFETSTTYEDAYNMVLKLARIVYAVDNSVNVETAPANLNDLFAGIKYFGVDADFVDEIAVSWAGYVFNNSLYTAGQDVQVDASTF